MEVDGPVARLVWVEVGGNAFLLLTNLENTSQLTKQA